jgi:hypothetical protein
MEDRANNHHSLPCLIRWLFSSKFMTILFLFPPLSLCPCSRQSYAGSGQVEVRDQTFHGCSSPSDGGATYINSASLVPVIANCTFLRCSITSGNDGGVFVSCRSDSDGSCGHINVTGASSLIYSKPTSTAAYAGYGNIWWLPTTPSCLKGRFDRGNVTGSKTVNWGCGLTFDTAYNSAFEFCELRSNNRTNCILLRGGSFSFVRCLSIRSNIGPGSATFSG